MAVDVEPTILEVRNTAEISSYQKPRDGIQYREVRDPLQDRDPRADCPHSSEQLLTSYPEFHQVTDLDDARRKRTLSYRSALRLRALRRSCAFVDRFAGFDSFQ